MRSVLFVFRLWPSFLIILLSYECLGEKSVINFGKVIIVLFFFLENVPKPFYRVTVSRGIRTTNAARKYLDIFFALHFLLR